MRGLREQGISCSALPKPFTKEELIRHVTRDSAALDSADTRPSRPIDATQTGWNSGATAAPAPVATLKHEYQPLLEICTAQLYQNNAFRITGFAVESSLREISKEAERLELANKLGMAGSASGPFTEWGSRATEDGTLGIEKPSETFVAPSFFGFGHALIPARQTPP